jgi:hypothetical protein
VTNFWFLGGPYDAAHQSSHPQHPPPHLMLMDPRLRPAFYLIFISLIAFLTLSIGVARCQQKKLERQQYEMLVANLDDSMAQSNTTGHCKDEIPITVVHAIECRDIRDENAQYEKFPTAPAISSV